MKKLSLMIAAALAATTASNVMAAGRDHIEIVGSSTVYPFATVVAETFGNKTKFKTPKIESTGSGGGMKLFCAGPGIDTPDITNASRRIKKSEFDKCQANGVKEITEVQVGFDGIAIANAKSGYDFSLTRKDIFLALAAKVPGKDGKLVANPCDTWKCVNDALPATKIQVLGPPPTSGTRDAFVELAMEGGAKKFADMAALRKAKGEEAVKPLMEKLGIPMEAYNKKGKKVFKAVAHHVREDGAYIELGENDNLIVQKLEKNTEALGIFGFSFLDQNSEKVKGSTIDGTDITFESIADGSYPVSRPLYFYVKNAHVGKVPGIAEFVKEFTEDDTWGEEGYLTEKGLIPLGDDARKAMGDNARAFKPLEM